jgi:type IV secretory pathway TrbD component
VTRDGDEPRGFSSPIYRFWERIEIWGVPRLWFVAWTAVCVIWAFSWLVRYRSWAALVPAAVWVPVWLLLAWLTKRDPQWDEVGLASLRYRSKYDAG